MIALLQRVTEAAVHVDGDLVGRIGAGLLVLLGVERGDSERETDRLLERVLGYRVFDDEQGRMNRSLLDVGGGLLVVSQFTLAAETRRGTRPGFSTAAAPDEGRRLYERFLAGARARVREVGTGSFGAHMRVSLVNDGPVTFSLRVAPYGTPAAAAESD
ncbi:MAG: D-aminoacyl-tRNA deacylase [Steroidobacteraceae bacterium]|jgi:D-tyrosyl-tRNA(Tyr) deacylase|nr:D-aminoacyl-tRNA deacylase [Steroidobacteraceae bacterium]